MKKFIEDFARMSGATDVDGGRAETVFCFTDQELHNFAEYMVKECIKVNESTKGIHRLSDWDLSLQLANENIKNHFGVYHE